MPYFIFAIQPFAPLEQLGACATFPEASRRVKMLRAAQRPGAPKRIRIMFAEDPIAAQDLLLAPREAPPEGDD